MSVSLQPIGLNPAQLASISVQPDASASTFKQQLSEACSDPNSDPKKVAKAAKDFEALMVGQVLKIARESSDGGWLGTGNEDQAGGLAMDIAEQQFAQAMAQGGGLGIAKLVTDGLARGKAKTASSDCPGSIQPTATSTDSRP